MSDGKEIYIATRGEGGLYRGGERTDSDAIAKGTGAWALDEETLAMLHKRGVELVGIHWWIHDQLYLTEITNYYDREKFIYTDFSHKGGSPQRFLNASYFRVHNRFI